MFGRKGFEGGEGSGYVGFKRCVVYEGFLRNIKDIRNDGGCDGYLQT